MAAYWLTTGFMVKLETEGPDKNVFNNSPMLRYSMWLTVPGCEYASSPHSVRNRLLPLSVRFNYVQTLMTHQTHIHWHTRTKHTCL